MAWGLEDDPPLPWCVLGTLPGVPRQRPISRQVFRGADAGNLRPFLAVNLGY